MITHLHTANRSIPAHHIHILSTNQHRYTLYVVQSITMIFNIVMYLYPFYRYRYRLFSVYRLPFYGILSPIVSFIYCFCFCTAVRLQCQSMLGKYVWIVISLYWLVWSVLTVLLYWIWLCYQWIVYGCIIMLIVFWLFGYLVYISNV